MNAKIALLNLALNVNCRSNEFGSWVQTGETGLHVVQATIAGERNPSSVPRTQLASQFMTTFRG